MEFLFENYNFLSIILNGFSSTAVFLSIFFLLSEEEIFLKRILFLVIFIFSLIFYIWSQLLLRNYIELNDLYTIKISGSRQLSLYHIEYEYKNEFINHPQLGKISIEKKVKVLKNSLVTKIKCNDLSYLLCVNQIKENLILITTEANSFK